MAKTNRYLFLFFFVSGFCGLVYQTVWVRLAYFHFGVTTPVFSVVLSVFMLGLALGSKAMGAVISPLALKTRRSSLFYYGLCEVLIGLGGLLVPALFTLGDRALLSLGETDSAGYLFFSGCVILLSLLPWCFFMGATFPLAMQFAKEVDKSESQSFSFLYLANVLGAVGGTLATAFILVECLGFEGTLHLAALLNFLIGSAAFLWSFRFAFHAEAPPAEAALPAPAGFQSPSSFPLIRAYLFMSGFASMAMEVCWVRDFTPVLGNQVYAFSKILAAYLLATWAGSWLYRRDLKAGRNYSLGLVTGLVSVFAFLPVLLNDPNHFHDNVLTLLSLVPFCAGLGYLTPHFIDQASGGEARKGGAIYAWNILGCILGPLLASFFLLPFLSARVSLSLLALPFLGFHLFFAGKEIRGTLRWAPGFLSLLLLVASLFVCGSFEEGWNLSKMTRYSLKRDYAATVVAYERDHNKGIFINGIGTAYLTPLTKVMAHLPLLLCPHPPRSALVICFGMGTTFRSLASWGIDTTAVELVPSVKEDFSFGFPDAPRVLARPNVRILIDDGRRFLLRTRRKYDVITLDPQPPVEAAGSSLLYSVDFYRELQGRLAEGGVVQQWIPDGDPVIQRAFIRSFVKAFPHVMALHSYEEWGTHLIGSMVPLAVPGIPELVKRMPEDARKDLMEWKKTGDLPDFLRLILSKRVDVKTLLDPDERIVVTDDRPLNEYYFLRQTFPSLFRY